MTEMTDQELLELIDFCEEKKAEADSRLKKLKHELFLRKEKEVIALFGKKIEPYGDVTIEWMGKKIKFSKPKKINWDQTKLSDLAKQIVADGAELSEYIDTEYNVPERRWNEWGNNIRSHFEDARTVTPGNISIKIEDIKEKE